MQTSRTEKLQNVQQVGSEGANDKERMVGVCGTHDPDS